MFLRLLTYMPLIAASTLFSGCAAIVTGTEQTISVETPGCPGARCKLVNDKGTWYVSNTPGTVTVHRSYSALTITCAKEGIQNDEIGVATSSTKGMAFGNILFGGVIGAGVDVGTGSAYDYPEVVKVPMDCGEAGKADAEVSMPAKPADATATGPDMVNGPITKGEEDFSPDCRELKKKLDDDSLDEFTRKVVSENFRARCSPGTKDQSPD